MAKGQISHHRNAQIKAAFAQHLLEAEARPGLIVWRFTALKAAKAKARQLLQGATQAPVGQQAIDAIGGFANVFQQQHAAGQLGAVLGAQQVRRHGEVAHQQRAFGDSPLPSLTLQWRQRFAR